VTLKRIRKAKGFSQYALAKATQPPVSREYIRKLEAGESDPTIGMLQRLAAALGVRITELLSNGSHRQIPDCHDQGRKRPTAIRPSRAQDRDVRKGSGRSPGV